MGHRNTQFTDHRIDAEIDQQGHSHLHPEPCIFYGSVANFPQPNFNFHHVPERYDGALLYGMPQLNSVQPRHPATNLDLAIAAPSGHYNPYVGPTSGPRDFPVQVNHGAHDHLSLSSSHRIAGIPTDNYGRNIPYMDSMRGAFKRKNAEGAPWIYQYHNAPAGPSSSVASVNAMPTESDITLMDSVSFPRHEYGGNDPTSSMIDTGAQISVRNNSHLIPANFVAPPVQLPGNPWLDMHFGANNGDIGTYTWAHAPLPYAQVHDISAGVSGANNRSSSGFVNPPLPPQGHPNGHHWLSPMQGVRGYNVNLQSQVATLSRRISTISSSSMGTNPFQDVVDARPTFLAPGPPMGFRLYQPQQREIILDSSARHHPYPHLRVLPEDEVAILEIPGYREAGDSIDHHRDMRLDIDHMSYEELLALGEQIGNVVTGLSDEVIRKNLKIRTFASSAICPNLEEGSCLDQQINFCVICQTDYKDEEDIGTVDCGHEYHRECIKKWLLVKNTCPVCKSTALSRNAT